MPLYEYQCKKCHKRFERIQKFSDPPVRKCPHCKGSVEKLISRSAVQFKGTGWYVTDYPSKSAQATESKSSEETKPAADKAEAKAETKTDAKTEAKPATKEKESKKSSKPKAES